MAARGWAVCEVPDATRALRDATTARFDLVVAGPMMDGMETAAFFAALRARTTGSRPIMAAVLEAASDVPALIEAGADHCLAPALHGPELGTALDVLAARVARRSRGASFRDFFENAPDGMFTATLDRRLTEVNRTVEEVTGYSRAELIGMSLSDLIAPEEHERGVELARQKVTGEAETTKFEMDVVAKDGHTVPLEIISHLLTEDGQPVAIQFVARDIANRRRVEEALRASEARFRSLVQNAFEVVTISDPDGTLRYVSPSVERLMGYTAEEWAGRGILSFIHPDDLPAATTGFANAVNFPGVRKPLELRVRHRDGSWRVLETVAYNLLDDPAVRGIVHNSRDVTERRHAEDESARLAAIVESTEDAVIARDARGRITSWNVGAERMYGYSAAEMVGTQGDPIVPPELFEERNQAGRRALKGESTGGFETVRLTKDGRRIPVAGSLFPIRNRAGEIVGNATIARDVSERKRNEEQLRKAGEFTTSVMNTVNNAIASLDLDGTITLANDRLVEMTGYSREELIGRRIETLVPPEEVTRLATVVLEANLGKAAGKVEARAIRKDGNLFDVAFSVAPLFENGVLAGFVGSAEDITERKKAEENLRLLAAVVESTDEAVFCRTLDDHVLTWNAGAERLFGFTFDEVRDAGVAQIVPPDKVEELAWIRSLIEGGGSVRNLETVRVDRDGRRIDELLSVFPVVDAAGEVIAVASIGNDISASKQAERALRTAEEYLRTVAANAPVVLAAVDTDGVFTLSEGAGLAKMGLRPGEVVGKSVYELFGDLSGVADSIRRCLAGEEFSAEVRMGDDLVFDNHYVPLRDAAGNVVGAIGVSVDITERRRAEQALLQAQKLESLGVLAGGIAHDFNNLLVSILGNAGLALMELSPQSVARDTIHEIEIAGQRAADLARQMLAYSGKGRFVIQQVDLNELVEEMTHLLRVSIAKGAILHYAFGQGLPAIEGDATQIRQVVMNLVVNASDAIGDRDGVIRVSTGLMHADRAYLTEPYLDPELPEGEYVYVEVEDTGQGMDADTLGKIFDPFFTTKFTGRGHGLAAVLGIIRGHRGAIKVWSTPGKGTTFRLLLPASAAAPEEVSIAADPSAWKGTGTILVIDDEETVRAVTARACRMFGFDVLTAPDGQAGVELFRQHAGEVACVLMDMTMPRLNGEDAFRQVHDISPEARVIMMSGFDQEEAASRFAGEGMAGFLQKPYDVPSLRDELRRVLES